MLSNLIDLVNKKLTFGLIFPLTIISFGTFTKWWYVLPVDAPDTMMAGFPWPFVSDGWHTSLSLQIFLGEFILDFTVYVIFWFLIITLVDRYFNKVKVPLWITYILWIFATIIVTVGTLIASMPDQKFYVKRNWDMKVLTTGYKVTFRHQSRPEFSKFDSKQK